MNFSKIKSMVGKDKEGVAYIVHKTMKAIASGSHPDKAFQDAAEDENYHLDRADIVSDRKLSIDTLHKLGHKVNDFPKSEKAASLDHWTTNYKFKKGSMNLINRVNKLLKLESSDKVQDTILKYGYVYMPKRSTSTEKHYQHPKGHSVVVLSNGTTYHHNASSMGAQPDYKSTHDPIKMDNYLRGIHGTVSASKYKKPKYKYAPFDPFPFKESLDLNEAHSHEDIANNPPKFVPIHHHDVWKALVLRDKHTNYGSAVNHYKRHMFKHGTVGATKMAKVSLGQNMTAESFISSDKEQEELLNKYGYRRKGTTQEFRHKDAHVVSIKSSSRWNHSSGHEGRGLDSLRKHLDKVHTKYESVNPLISRAKSLLGITELDDNPLDSKVSDSSDKLNHSDKKTTMGLIKSVVRKYKAFGGVNHSALKNDAKSHSASSRLSSK